METVMNYIIGGVIALLILFSLAPTVFSQYGSIDFTNAPAGVEATVGAVLTIFFVLVLWRMYNSASDSSEM